MILIIPSLLHLSVLALAWDSKYNSPLVGLRGSNTKRLPLETGASPFFDPSLRTTTGGRQLQTTSSQHVFKIYLNASLVTNITSDKAALDTYVADMNTVLAKNTNCELLFDPDNDIIQVGVSDQFPPHGTAGVLNVSGYEIRALVQPSALSVSHGGYMSFDQDGSAYLAGLNWVQIYDPSTLQSNTDETKDWWKQMTAMLHEIGHIYGAGISEYYSMNIVNDDTGEPPSLNIANYMSNQEADPYWQDKLDFMSDPLLWTIYNSPLVGSPVSRMDLVAASKFSNLTAAMVSAEYRYPQVWLEMPDMDSITLVAKDSSDGAPVVDAQVKIWSVRSFPQYVSTLLYNGTTAADGTYTFAWNVGGGGLFHSNYNHLRLIKIYHGSYSSEAKYVSVFDGEMVSMLEGLNTWTFEVQLDSATTTPAPTTAAPTTPTPTTPAPTTAAPTTLTPTTPEPTTPGPTTPAPTTTAPTTPAPTTAPPTLETKYICHKKQQNAQNMCPSKDSNCENAGASCGPGGKKCWEVEC